MATDNVSHTVHAFLRDDPMGQMIARHAQYSPGHPTFDEHENEQRQPGAALLNAPEAVPGGDQQGSPLLQQGGGPGPFGPEMTPEQGGGGQGPDVLPGRLPQGQPVSVRLNNAQQAGQTQQYINAHSTPGKDDYGA